MIFNLKIEVLKKLPLFTPIYPYFTPILPLYDVIHTLHSHAPERISLIWLDFWLFRILAYSSMKFHSLLKWNDFYFIPWLHNREWSNFYFISYDYSDFFGIVSRSIFIIRLKIWFVFNLTINLLISFCYVFC